MKIVKLAVIFVVLVGGIFLALNWDSLFKSSSGEDDFVKEDLIDISDKCAEIRKAWAAQKEFSYDLYKAERDDIDQSKSMGMFSREGYNTVNNCLRETATNKACEGYMVALHASPFSDAAVRRAYNGVVAIKKAERLANEPRVQRVERINGYYASVRSFVNSSHKITPHFNTGTADWASFASLENNILSKAKALRGNALFKDIENVPGVKSGLDAAALKKKTSAQRPAFYRGLSAQIVSYFKAQEPTTDKVNLLNQIYKNFTYQERTYGVNELARLVVSYGNAE